MKTSLSHNQKLIETLKNGGIVVMPTDTIYGILTSALNQESVERLYQVRQRSPEKPCIILMSNISDIEKFGISLGEIERKILLEFFALPKPTSVILDCPNQEFSYLHRGTNSLSFRLPKNEDLVSLIKEIGPLIAPSANTEGNIPASSLLEAREYFGEKVDLYINGGEIKGQPSKIVKLSKNGDVSIIRN